MTLLYYLAIVIFLLTCFLLGTVILMQESKSSGFGASFGGGDGQMALFGASTANVLKRFTGYLIALFLGSCIILSLWTQSKARSAAPLPQYQMEEISG